MSRIVVSARDDGAGGQEIVVSGGVAGLVVAPLSEGDALRLISGLSGWLYSRIAAHDGPHVSLRIPAGMFPPPPETGQPLSALQEAPG